MTANVTRTLYGACGNMGCLDCTPTSVVYFDPQTGAEDEIYITFMFKEDDSMYSQEY